MIPRDSTVSLKTEQLPPVILEPVSGIIDLTMSDDEEPSNRVLQGIDNDIEMVDLFSEDTSESLPLDNASRGDGMAQSLPSQDHDVVSADESEQKRSVSEVERPGNLTDTSVTSALDVLRRRDMLSEEQEERLITALSTNRETLRAGKYTLLGMSAPIRHHQAAVLSQLIEGQGENRNGFLLADAMGLGKTWSVVAMWCFLRLCTMNAQHFARYRDLHKKGPRGTCGFDNPFSIQCVCVEGSITALVAARVTHGPYVIFAPSSVVPNWANTINQLIYRRIKVTIPLSNGKRGKIRHVFLQAAQWTSPGF